MIIDKERFAAAIKRAEEECPIDGIGTLSEGAVHKALKYYIEPNSEHHEAELFGMVVDILNGDGVTEIQTANFGYLKSKLKRLLPTHPVTVIYPLAGRKTVVTLDKATGEVISRRVSNRHMTVYDAGRELYAISDFLTDDRLRVELLLLDCEEYRIREITKGGRVRTRRLSMRPTGIISVSELCEREDFLIFLPDTLGDEFVAKEYYKAIKSRSRYTYYCLRLLSDLGLIAHTDTRRRAFVYTRIKEMRR